MPFARGDRAVGLCQRCGFKYLLKELKEEYTHLLVCPTCFDPEPEDRKPGPRVFDPEALRRPAPDTDLADANARGTITQLNTVVNMSFEDEAGDGS